MKTILICGYRDWAVDLFTAVRDNTKNINLIYLDNKNILEEKVFKLKPNIIFFIGWSWIVKKKIIDNFICICLHPSPLPKYRGGSPIQHQIINGEINSAVSLFIMNHKLDQGDILFQKKFSLNGNLDDIFRRISKIGSEGVISIILDKVKKPIKQNESEATFFNRRNKSMSEITLADLQRHTAKEIYNKVRALQDPYPNAFLKCHDGTKLYLKQVVVDND